MIFKSKNTALSIMAITCLINLNPTKAADRSLMNLDSLRARLNASRATLREEQVDVPPSFVNLEVDVTAPSSQPKPRQLNLQRIPRSSAAAAAQLEPLDAPPRFSSLLAPQEEKDPTAPKTLTLKERREIAKRLNFLQPPPSPAAAAADPKLRLDVDSRHPTFDSSQHEQILKPLSLREKRELAVQRKATETQGLKTALSSSDAIAAPTIPETLSGGLPLLSSLTSRKTHAASAATETQQEPRKDAPPRLPSLSAPQEEKDSTALKTLTIKERREIAKREAAYRNLSATPSIGHTESSSTVGALPAAPRPKLKLQQAPRPSASTVTQLERQRSVAPRSSNLETLPTAQQLRAPRTLDVASQSNASQVEKLPLDALQEQEDRDTRLAAYFATQDDRPIQILDGQRYRLLDAIERDPPIGRILCDNFLKIFEGVMQIRHNANVHVLDNFIFGPQGHITNFIEITRILNIGDGRLSWKEIQNQILAMLPEEDAQELFVYREENEEKVLEEYIVTVGILKTHIQKYFATFPKQLVTYFTGRKMPQRCEQVQELLSRIVTIAPLLGRDPTILDLLGTAISENCLTRGGCPQGCTDRIFTLALKIYGSAGLHDLVLDLNALSKK